MSNLVALSLMVSDKKIFKDFDFFKFDALATRVFEGIEFLQKLLKRAKAGTFL